MLTELKLRNFRNYKEIKLEFQDGVNLFIGDNGQGKTNLLEAIYFLSILRSFRTRRIQDIKKIGTSGFYIAGKIISEYNWPQLVEIEYHTKRILRIDGKNIHKATDFIGIFNTVVFAPTDILIVTGSAGVRRRFFDILLSFLYPEYLNMLTEYTSVIHNRNILLKEHTKNKHLLNAFDFSLAALAGKISVYRNYMVAVIEKIVNHIMNKMGRKAEIKIFYKSNCKLISANELRNKFNNGSLNNEECLFEIERNLPYSETDTEYFFRILQKEKEKDFLRGFTGIGPHTDDFDFIADGQLLKSFGSTGQCRLFSICLKLAQFMLVRHNNIKKNVVLIDDVTNDLDADIKYAFLNILKTGGQMFFTFCNLYDVDNNRFFDNALRFKIKNGSIVSTQ